MNDKASSRPMQVLVRHPRVAVLFAREGSVYHAFSTCDVYDQKRDARTFAGGMPIIAHPPCRTWGCLKAFSTAPAEEHALGPWAVAQIRRWGGVLEHPKGSSLFRECGIPRPGCLPDEWGGWTLEVDQFHWGHKARKRTWLYIVGTRQIPMRPWRLGEPTHVIDRPGSARKRERPNSAGLKPWVSNAEREQTPPEFAAWLLEVARSCRCV